MSHDLLLEWASERGDGRWEGFRNAHEWLFPPGRADGWSPTPGWSARRLSALGHIEIDWLAGRWTALAPVMTLLPSAGAYALLTGGRTRTLLDRLDAAVWDETDDVYLTTHPQRDAPSALLLAGDDERALESLAARLKVPYELSVGDRLSRLLPTLDSCVALGAATPAVARYGLERFDVDGLEWRAAELDREPGLYRYEAFGPPLIRLLDDDGATYDVDLAVGVYGALARWGGDVLRYESDPVNGTLVVPLGAPLPPLQARAAALCSGMAPPLQRQQRVLRYWNVPRDVADRIARSLEQTLAIGHENGARP